MNVNNFEKKLRKYLDIKSFVDHRKQEFPDPIFDILIKQGNYIIPYSIMIERVYNENFIYLLNEIYTHIHLTIIEKAGEEDA